MCDCRLRAERGQTRLNVNVPEPVARKRPRRTLARTSTRHLSEHCDDARPIALSFTSTCRESVRVGVRRARARARSSVCVRLHAPRAASQKVKSRSSPKHSGSCEKEHDWCSSRLQTVAREGVQLELAAAEASQDEAREIAPCGLPARHWAAGAL